MTATSVTASSTGRSHAIILASNADFARTVGLIEGLSHLNGGTIATTVETITLVYPGAMLPIWTNVSFLNGPGAGTHSRPTRLVKPRRALNTVVYLTAGLFERLCGNISGMFCTMVPLTCTTLTIVGETEGLPDWSEGCPPGPIRLPSSTGVPFTASQTPPPGIVIPALVSDAASDMLYLALRPGSPSRDGRDTPHGMVQCGESDISDSASIISNPSSLGAMEHAASMEIPDPVIALPSHPSEQYLNRRPLADVLDPTAVDAHEDSNKENSQRIADDELQGVPCHECGTIVRIYRKRTWYAVIRGLEVGVRHTWKATRPLVEHDNYNLSGIVHFVFHTRAEAEEKFTDELRKGNVKVLNLAEIARPRK